MISSYMNSHKFVSYLFFYQNYGNMTKNYENGVSKINITYRIVIHFLILACYL